MTDKQKPTLMEFYDAAQLAALRDQMAMAALSLGGDHFKIVAGRDPVDIAIVAYEIADAMLERRDA